MKTVIVVLTLRSIQYHRLVTVLIRVWTGGSQSGRNRPHEEDFEGQGGEKNKKNDMGAKQHKGAKTLNH